MESGYEIIMDTREHHTVKQLARMMKLPFREEALPCADFALRDIRERPFKVIAGIERKAVPDLVQSIQSQRLFDQIDRIYKAYDLAFLFISGSLADHNLKMKEMGFKINPAVIYGTLTSIIVRAGIHVMWLPDDSALLDAAYRTLEKISENKYGQPLKRRPKYEEYDSVRVLMHVPGVTQEKAEALKKRFISLRNIADARPEQLTVVDGIGMTTAQAIWRLFNA